MSKDKTLYNDTNDANDDLEMVRIIIYEKQRGTLQGTEAI